MSKKKWNEIYKKREEKTSEVDENLPRIVTLLKKRRVKRILDLGCGSGRHTVYLAQNGFEVYGIDFSVEGVKRTRDRLRNVGLIVNLKIGSIYATLPYGDNFFDVVISTRTINHGRIREIRRAIKEIERVLKQGGLIFVTTRKRIAGKKRLPYKYIAPRTYAPLEGKEKGVVHYSFTKSLLRKEFKNFKIHTLWTDKNDYYCLLGELKK